MGNPGNISAPQRNYGQETRDTLQAQLDLAPELLRSEQQYGPQYQQLQLDMLKSSMPQMMDIYSNVAPQLQALEASNTRAQREADIAAVRDLGPQATEAMKASNPEMAKLISSMTGQAQSGLDAGSKLTSDQSINAQQASRQAWAARGLAGSPSAAMDEVLTERMAGAGEQDRRRQFAGGVVGMQQAAYGNPFQAILARPVGTSAAAMAMGQQATGMQPGRIFQPESQYSADVYGSNAQTSLAAGTANAANKAAMFAAWANAAPDSA